jgi:hypothetical protein
MEISHLTGSYRSYTSARVGLLNLPSAARIMNVNSQAVLEIRQSPWRMIGLIVAGVVLTALSAGIAFDLLPDLHASSYQELVSYVGVVLFALCTAIAVWRLLSVRGPVVTVTPEGIRDTRIAAELIPWGAVARISTWQYRGQRILVLAVDPAVERRLTLTRLARWSRRANRALGANGLCIAVAGLDIGFDALLAACTRCAQPRSAVAGGYR